jgi:hypothetical protein
MIDLDEDRWLLAKDSASSISRIESQKQTRTPITSARVDP